MRVLEKAAWQVVSNYNDYAWKLGRINKEQMQSCNNRIAAVKFLQCKYRREAEELIAYTSAQYRVVLSPSRTHCTCMSYTVAPAEQKGCKHIDASAMKYLEYLYGVAK